MKADKAKKEKERQIEIRKKRAQLEYIMELARINNNFVGIREI